MVLMLNLKFNRNVYINVTTYGNVLSCINIYIFILNYICMHVLRHYESLKMCKECICVLMIK